MTRIVVQYNGKLTFKYSLVPNIRPPALINFSKFFQPGHSYSNLPGYYISGETPSNTSFQDIRLFYIDENKTLPKNKKSILNLGEFSNPPAN